MPEPITLHHNVVLFSISFGRTSGTFMAYRVFSKLVKLNILGAIESHALIQATPIGLNWGIGWNLVARTSVMYRLLKDINNRMDNLFNYFSAVYNEAGCYVNDFQRVAYLNEKIIQHYGQDKFPKEFNYTNLEEMKTTLAQFLVWKTQVATMQEEF